MSFASPWVAGLLALFLWWFSTGAILWLVRRADRAGSGARRAAVIATLPVALLGVFGLWASIDSTSVAGAYAAFLSAMAIWGWIELTFLNGIITGPNQHPMPERTPEWERFVRAWGTIAYHELLLVAVFTALIFAAESATNLVGIATYGLLFLARISAKLNLYLGVAKINTEFLPDTLTHLPSHFRSARMNWLFPVSITALSFATAWWVIGAAQAENAGTAIGYALLGALAALALLEHWFMVLPLPDERLWRWMLPKPNENSQAVGLSEEAR